ncbi:protein kinase [Bifidobacterium pullorum subsp. saeculare]|uniref:non-specific serine/threonine protein kinase n=1 Tax=Bifidobacterium pullorum subsp. saeculare TaxID=78257 RepID=A0A938WWL1_9BIFI|nr:serine/threonine-protein kinase [Bifidobacterium pullorum]MBM6699579.1 protein kinase [Bifidobacterium pullorum subsp. saeculare]
MSDLNALNLEPGEVVGGYTLVSRLGAGAMGSVWRVRDGGGQIYAMKILRDSLVDDAGASPEQRRDQATARERLRREAMALKKVNHPGVCAIVDMELDDALAFIVTELIEGRNLREDVAVNGRYVGADLERLAAKLIDAVKAVHAAGIVHRDIKPTNVMVSASGPVLVDFGIAMTGGESHVTRTGLVMGTPGFIAPEIIDGAESDEATDWWSVASVLAFAATGRPVFGTKPMMAVLERAAAGNADLAGLPPHTLAAFRSALSPDRARRCTPDQMLHAIALDALNPFASLPPADGPADPAADDGTQVVRPFDLAARAGNPRLLWGGDDDASATRALAPEQCTVALPSDALDARTVPTARLEAGTAPLTRATAVLPETEPPRPPMATVPLQRLVANAAAATEPSSVVAPAVGDRTEAMPAPAIPSRRDAAEGTAVLPPAPPAGAGTVPDFLRGEASPSEIVDAQLRVAARGQAAPPNPADVRRGLYLKRSRLTLLLLAVPMAVAGMVWPPLAPLLAAAAFWLMQTLGYGLGATLEREWRRGGAHTWSDSALRVASFPWHLAKGLLSAVLRAALMAAEYLAMLAVAVLALQLPTLNLRHTVLGMDLIVPQLVEGPLSLTGVACALTAAAAWLLAAFWPHSPTLRLGAGALRGSVRAPQGMPPAADA